MRENRTSGSEGGEAPLTRLSYPYQRVGMAFRTPFKTHSIDLLKRGRIEADLDVEINLGVRFPRNVRISKRLSFHRFTTVGAVPIALLRDPNLHRSPVSESHDPIHEIQS